MAGRYSGKKEGKLKGKKEVTITDLPGIYSLSPYTLEEVVARNYLIHERPDVILNIVDGTNVERNLYLSTQLMELGIPVILAVNMIDILEKNGDQIHIGELKKRLGCEIVEISALKGTGVQKAAQKALQLAEQKTAAAPVHQFAKEVGTFGILFGFAEVAEDGTEIWGALAGSMSAAAYSFPVFNLLCAPCFAAMGAIKREMNHAAWFWFAVGYQTALAYVVSLCVYQIGMWITAGAFGIGTVAAGGAILAFVYLLFRPNQEEGRLRLSRMAGVK